MNFNVNESKQTDTAPEGHSEDSEKLKPNLMNIDTPKPLSETGEDEISVNKSVNEEKKDCVSTPRVS